MNTKKMLLMGALVALTGAQCWGGNQANPTEKLLVGATYVDKNLVNEALQGGADVNAQDPDGKTALMRLVISRDSGGDTGIDRDNYHNLRNLLLEKGADVNIKDKGGKTVLTYVIDLKGPESKPIDLDEKATYLEILVKKALKSTEYDALKHALKGRNPQEIVGDDVEIINFLIKDINVKNEAKTWPKKPRKASENIG